MEKRKNKTDRVNIRITSIDKENAEKKAAERQMSLSEYIVYLIRKDCDK